MTKNHSASVSFASIFFFSAKRKWIANGRLVRKVRISLAGKISSTPVRPQIAGRMKTQGIKNSP